MSLCFVHLQQQKGFEPVAVCGNRLAAERDAAERDSREKETKILSQSQELDELRNRLAEAERLGQQQQAELTELMSSKDDVGKNVSLSHVTLISVICCLNCDDMISSFFSDARNTYNILITKLKAHFKCCKGLVREIVKLKFSCLMKVLLR